MKRRNKVKLQLTIHARPYGNSIGQETQKATGKVVGRLEDDIKNSCLLLPLNVLGQLADHYCHWFLELSSRISESTTGYTFTACVGYFTSTGIDTR